MAATISNSAAMGADEHQLDSIPADFNGACLEEMAALDQARQNPPIACRHGQFTSRA